MLLNALTVSLIAAIVLGVGWYATRRVARTWREDRARTEANEAALLAEVTAEVAATPPTALSPTRTSSTQTSPARPADPSRVAAPPTGAGHAPGPGGVEAEIRAFLGTAPAAAPASRADSPVDPEIGSTAGDLPAAGFAAAAAAAGLAQALREAAHAVEEAAAREGSPAARAAYIRSVLIDALDALPLAALDGPDAPTVGLTARIPPT